MNKLLSLSFLFVSLLLPTTINAAGQPNFLFLLSDDQAWTGLSCEMHPDVPGSGSRVIETPNIARLASEGMRFSAAYSPASVCAPTRISLQTGKSPAQCQWTKAAGSMTEADGFKLIPPQNRRSIQSDETTIGELLQSAGYTTAHFGKWHISGGGPERHGYDESDGNTGNEAAAPFLPPNPVDIFGMGERAMALMEKSKQADKPFFIQMSYHALHYPQNAPPELVEKYAKLIAGGNEKEIGRSAMSEALDNGIGLLLEKIAALGIEEDTYVIYMSDNGSSTRGMLRGGKGGVWEGGVRVPLIVRGPGIAANSWSHQRVVGYDFYPTLCELAGVEQSLAAEIEGGSLSHLFRGEEEPVARPREELVFHFPHYQGDTPHSALLLDELKIVHFYETGQTHLFDLSSDIQESRDLSEQKPEVVSAMEAKLFAYLADVNAQIPKKNPSYDPDNPPTLKRGGGGGGRGKGGGGKGGNGGKGGKGGKKKMQQEAASPERVEIDSTLSAGPTADSIRGKEKEEPEVTRNPDSGASAESSNEIDLSPEAFEIAATGRASFNQEGSTGDIPGIQIQVEGFDVNGDGKVVESELMKQARTAFGAFDVDGNGVLTAWEFEDGSPETTIARFLTSKTKAIDANADSTITAVEFATRLREAFKTSDRNRDGSVSAADSSLR